MNFEVHVVLLVEVLPYLYWWEWITQSLCIGWSHVPIG